MEIFDYLQIICVKCMSIKKIKRKLILNTNILKRILPVLWVTKIDECKFQQFQEIKQSIPIILKLKVLLGNSNIFFSFKYQYQQIICNADAINFGITNRKQNVPKFAFH